MPLSAGADFILHSSKRLRVYTVFPIIIFFGNYSVHPDKLEVAGVNGEWKMENEVSPQTKAFCIFHYPGNSLFTGKD